MKTAMPSRAVIYPEPRWAQTVAQPRETLSARILGGWLPLALFLYGMACALLGHRSFGPRFIPLQFHEFAISFGIICLSIASLLRCRWLWNDRTRLSLLVMFAEDLSLMFFIAALLYIVVCIELS